MTLITGRLCYAHSNPDNRQWAQIKALVIDRGAFLNFKETNMTHYWGDKWSYWNDLYDAERMLIREMRRFKLPVFQIKEKWGYIRCSMGGPWRNLHDIVWAGHCFCRWPKKLSFMWHLDIYFWPKLFRYTGLQKLLNWVYTKAYVLAYERTVRAYPHIAREILADADHSRLLCHMADWNSYWESEVPYPQPSPVWTELLRKHNGLQLDKEHKEASEGP